MNIAIIGAGNMGAGLAARAHGAGHAVTLAGQDPAKTEATAQRIGVQSAPAIAAARDADIIVLAVPYPAAEAAIGSAGGLAGKTVVDVTNPLKPDYSGLTIGHSTSAAEEIQKRAPGARVVKGFNTVFAQVLGHGPDFGGGNRVPVFLAGDDAAAKQAVGQFAESLGFATIDAGPLAQARLLEPLGMLNIALGYGQGHGTAIAPAWIRRS